MDDLTKDLSQYGIVEVIKDDFVFTLHMTKSKEKISKNTLKIVTLVMKYLNDKKPIIEVMKNNDDFLLLVLKPKIDDTPRNNRQGI